MTATDEISAALRIAHSGWIGCDWDTEFGPERANLRGLSSRQARLAAEATRGSESQFWREAQQYLDQIERDRGAAANYASEAVDFWRLGNKVAAMERLESAINLEATYRSPVVYSKLREVLRASSPELSNSDERQEDCHAG